LPRSEPPMHHPIAIDHLTEAELMDLNHRV
jgi:hypothetical protein